MTVSGKHPIRNSANAAFNAGVLVFVGALVVNVVNHFLDEAVKSTSDNPQEPDLHAVVD